MRVHFPLCLKAFPMTLNLRLFALLVAVHLSLGGCSGHYKFSDEDYRPLGDPRSINK